MSTTLIQKITKSAILLCVACFSLLPPGCSRRDQPPAGSPSPAATVARTSLPAVPVFDGKRSYEFLVAQTRFGPRNPGSPGHRQCLDYLENELRQSADAVTLQPFSHIGYEGQTLAMTNVIASFRAAATTRILLLAHWDTRPRADQDPDPKKQSQPILGANDGASGVAVLLEIARHLKATPPSVGVDILFVDGEDYGKEHDTERYLLGARYFTQRLPEGFRPVYGILLDMVGDEQLELMKEQYSMQDAPDIVELVWTTARDLGIGQFSDKKQNWVTDDHVPFNRVGIKTIDLIDFDYPDESNKYWHTTQDTPDKCSPESLSAVGTVLLHVIYNQQ